MTKKDTVRKHLLKLANNKTFTMSSVASDCEVSTKDVSNVTNGMFKHGVFEREMIDGVQVYTVDANAVALYMAKYPNGQLGENKGGLNGDKESTPKTKPVKVKRRSAALVEIDNKIVFYHNKIDSLKIMRKEFT